MQPTHDSPVARLAPPALALAVALGLAGCNGVFLGNFVVLGLTFVVFFGTLGLGRARTPARPAQGSAERSQSDV